MIFDPALLDDLARVFAEAALRHLDMLNAPAGARFVDDDDYGNDAKVHEGVGIAQAPSR